MKLLVVVRKISRYSGVQEALWYDAISLEPNEDMYEVKLKGFRPPSQLGLEDTFMVEITQDGRVKWCSKSELILPGGCTLIRVPLSNYTHYVVFNV